MSTLLAQSTIDAVEAVQAASGEQEKAAKFKRKRHSAEAMKAAIDYAVKWGAAASHAKYPDIPEMTIGDWKRQYLKKKVIRQ